MSSVSIELVTGILRYHPDGRYGDPYTFVCTVLLDNETAIIKGAVGEYTKDVRQRIKEALIDLGVKRVVYERRNESGDPRYRTLESNVREAVDDDVGTGNGKDGQGVS